MVHLPGAAHEAALILPGADLWADPGAGLTRAVGRGEASRQGEARQGAARQEAAHQEVARQEAARQEAARQEVARQGAAALRLFLAEDPVARASPSGAGGLGEGLRREVVAGQEGGGSREDPSAGPTSGRG